MPTPKDTDPEKKDIDPTPGDDQVTDDGDQQSGGSDDQKTTVDWEARYKGLQSASEKQRTALQKSVEDLQTKLTAATEQLEQSNLTSSDVQKAQEQAKQEIEQIKGQLDAATQERDKLTAQLNRQAIIMKDYPALARFSDFIPAAEDDDQFKTNLQNFQEALNSYVQAGVKDTLSGSSPPPGGDQGTRMVSESEEDKLWKQVYSLAGIPGKEREYEEAFGRLQEVLNLKNT